MLLNEVENINLQAFNEKYPFKQTIQISVSELKEQLLTGHLRYVWLPACPRANRTTAVYKWYQLDKYINEHHLSPYYQLGENWVFDRTDSHFSEGSIQKYFPEEIRATQPFLYNKKTQTVITNDTYHMSMLMAEIMDEAEVYEGESLFPKEHRKMLQKWNAWLYEHVNLKIYQVAGKKGQEKAVGINELEETYELLNDYLANNHYLWAGQLTETDLRLFNNLIRHQLYVDQFGVFYKALTEFTHLNAYVQYLLAEHPVLKENTHWEEIQKTHFRSEHNIKKYGFVEEVPSIDSLFPFLENK